MVASRCSAFLGLALCFSLACAKENHAAAGKVLLNANPIRRVVTMLQAMQKKVTDEGKKEEELFDKFMCYCKNGKGSLEGSIATAKNTNEQLTASIKETEATLTQTKADLKSAQTDRADAKASVAKATAVREKEAGIYAHDSSDLK